MHSQSSLPDTSTSPRRNWRRRAWNSAGPTAGGRLARRLWRGGFVLLLGLLFAWLCLLLFQPLRHPHTHLACLSGGDYRLLHAAPIAFAAEDIDALAPLEAVLYTDATRSGPLVFGHLREQARMQALGIDLEQLLMGDQEVLLIHVTAHGISDQGTAYLLCRDFDSSGTQAGRYRVDDMLQQISATSAKTKLLILDTGRTAADRRLGAFVNQFPRLLADSVRETRDPTLWVLQSHWLLETSHVSVSLERSVFGYFVARGLKGDADQNGDAIIDLDELHRYVAANVRQWTERYTGGACRQTPVVSWGGGAWRPDDVNPVLLSVSRLGDEHRDEDLAAAVRAERGSSRSRTFRNLNVPPDGGAVDGSAQNFGATTSGPGWLRVNQRGNSVRQLRVQQSNQINSELRATRNDAKNIAQGGAAGAGREGDVPRDDLNQDTAGSEASEAGPVSGADGQAEVDQAAEPAPSPKAAATAPTAGLSDSAPVWIARAWQLRDRLESRAGYRASPVDYAPAQWREFQLWLQQTEQLYLAGGIGDPRRVVTRLRSALPTLASLPQAPPVEEGRRPGAAQRMAAAYSRDAVRDVGPCSLAMARLLDRHWPSPRTNDWAATAGTFAALMTAGSGEELYRWLEQLDNEYDRFEEIRFARRLANLGEVDWRDIQFALETQLLAADVAASEPWCRPWVADRLLAADRLRLAGQRELTDRVGAGRVQNAARLLRAAHDLYRQSADDVALVQAATFAVRDLLQRAPHYVAWHTNAGPTPDAYAPQHGDLAELLQTLFELSVALESPDPDQLSQVRRLHDGLSQWRRRAERGLATDAIDRLTKPPPAAGDSWRVQMLLATPLPDAAVRLKLLGVSNGVDGLMAAAYEPAKIPPQAPRPTALSLADWQFIQRRAELELLLARLAEPNAGETTSELATIEEAWTALSSEIENRSAAQREDQPLWTTVDEFSAALAEFHVTLPARIEAAIRTGGDLSQPSSRTERKRRLRAADRALRMVDARDAAATLSLNPRARLFDAEMYDLLLWQADRYRLAAADAPAAEAGYLFDAAQACRTGAGRIPRQPPAETWNRPRIELSGPTSIALTSQTEAKIEVALALLGTPAADAWLQVRYDPQLIDVVAPREVTVYRQITPRPTVTEPAYPYDEGLLQQPPSLKLRAGADEKVRFTITRKQAFHEPGRLIVKVVMADGSARCETDVMLPVPHQIRHAVVGAPGSWTQTADGTVLHPFPNRRTDYQLLLANDDRQDKVVRVELAAAGRRVSAALPPDSLSSPDALRVLDRFSPRTILAVADDVTLPVGGRLAPVPFPPPADEDAAAEAESPASGDLTDSAATIPAKPIDYGLLLLVTDKQSDRVTIRWLDVAPQRPRRYVLPRVGYNLDLQRLTIDVSPQDEALIPPTGVKVRAEIVGGLPPASKARLHDEIEAPDFAARLYADIPAGNGRVVTVHLWVDDYPRAFIFDVPCDRHDTDVPEQKDRLAIRIVSPPAGTSYQSPAGPVPVEFQVDAPPGSFQRGRDVVEVGVDEDGDRDFRGETTLRLPTDRQVAARFVRAAPQGRVAIETTVGDFAVHLPAPTVQNARAGVLGRVMAGGRTAWSRPVEVVLDATPPRVLIEQVERQPAGVVEVGAPLVIAVPVVDDELSGVASVEAAFDVVGTGEFAEEPAPAPAKQADDGRWSVELDTAALPSGAYRVLLRATDKVGNAGRYESLPVEVLTPEDAALRRAAMTNTVAGAVHYGTRPVRGATLTLTSDDVDETPETTADDQGQFEFTGVPPGEYRLSVKGLAAGVNRFKELAVTVPPAPERVPPLRIRMDRRDQQTAEGRGQ
jgi:hypothetical protein